MKERGFSRSRRLASVVALLTLVLPALQASGRPVWAAEPSGFTSGPVLRLETGMHTAAVRRIDVDRSQRYLVSGAHDPSVRVWDVRSGRLLRTLRIPQGEGDAGQVYCVAISPDGATVAVGGWTGREGGNFIFVYDRETGEIRKAIGGLPNTALHLVYSPDGSHLAATLGGANGLRVYETRNHTLEHEDREYGGSAYWADFDGSGRLLTTCSDGTIRLYDRDFRFLHKEQAPGGKEPFGVAFSPDGRDIAVGYDDSTRVDVLSSGTLALRFSADTSGVTGGNLSCVAWSEDGGFLYAAGRYNSGVFNPIRRWSDGGGGGVTELEQARDTVMALKPLSEGRLAVGAGGPLVSVLSRDGQPIWQRRGEIADFRGQRGEDGIRVSRNGDSVRFGYEVWGKRPARFSFKTLRLELDPPADDGLFPPETGASGLEITGWADSYNPMLNGTSLELEEGEASCSLAITPDRKRFLLGTYRNLRLFDHTGNRLWSAAAPGVAWTVNISGDGRLAVAGLSDGTLRWYRMTDGAELLALFPHADGRRWAAWTPRGHYTAAAGADDLLGRLIDHGMGKAPELQGASRFRERLYRPDVVARVLETLDEEKAFAPADR